MTQIFLPLARMRERVGLALDDSDTAYFYDLLFCGEMVAKILVVELLAALQDDREHHRYGFEYRLLRADGLGEWAEVLDEALTGPASQHLLLEGRQSQQAMTTPFGPGADAWQRRAVDSLNEVCRSLDADQEDLASSKVSLRRLVRSFVWLRNRTRGHGATQSETSSMLCQGLAASIDEVIAHAPAFSRSWAYLRRSLSGKYKVSRFGGDREAFAYLASEADHSYADGAYVFVGSPRPANLLFTNSDLTDFSLPNGHFREGRFEVLSYVTDDRRVEDGRAWSLPVEAQAASETSAVPNLDVVGEAWTNMPPPRVGYVARSALEDELHRILEDSRHPVVTLQGRGGVVKTSLTLEVLHRVASKPNFYAIIWFSARDIDLLPDGPKVVRADVLTINDVAKDFMRLLRPSQKTTRNSALEFLTTCLSGQAEDGPFLFVFDNFETIREQGQLYQYVSNAIRLPNKVLVTTRTRDFRADYPIEVRGMARGEYHTLVDAASTELRIRHLIDDSYESVLYDESDGHPYITKVLLGEVAHEGRAVDVKRVVATKDAMLDALFDRSFASLSPASQRVFLTLCSWRSLVPRIGLEAVLLRPGNERLDVDGALAELGQASLVEELRDPSEDPPFLSVPLVASLFGMKKLVTSPLKIAIEADLELVRSFGAVTTTEMSRGLGPRVDRLTREIARRSESNVASAQEIAVLEYIASAYPPAWLNLAQLQQEQGELSQAIKSTNRYLEARPDDQEAWRKLISHYRSTDGTLGEMHARLQLCQLPNSSFNELSVSASRLNGLLARREIQLDTDERQLMVTRFRSLMEAHVDEADATDLSRLAWLCLYGQDVDSAGRWAQAGLDLDSDNQYCLRLQRRLAGGEQTA